MNVATRYFASKDIGEVFNRHPLVYRLYPGGFFATHYAYHFR